MIVIMSHWYRKNQNFRKIHRWIYTGQIESYIYIGMLSFYNFSLWYQGRSDKYADVLLSDIPNYTSFDPKNIDEKVQLMEEISLIN